MTALGPLAAPPEVRAALALLAAWIESQRAYGGLPALSIGIVHDQEPVWAAGFGQADPARHAPATSGTLYRSASITTLFTAMSPAGGGAPDRDASEHTSRAEDTAGYAGHGEPVLFEMDAAGRARRMRVGENYLDAVDAW